MAERAGVLLAATLLAAAFLHAADLLLWLVPWDPDNGTYEGLFPHLGRVAVGVVFAFDTWGLGNKTVSLQEALGYGQNGRWLAAQLAKLEAAYSRSNGSVYVSFFLSTTPWRYYIAEVTPAQLALLNHTLAKIAEATGGGRRLVVGTSEMGRLSRVGYYQIYALMRRALPHARLFYCADFNQDAEAVAEIYNYLAEKGVKLDYLCHHVYPWPAYDYNGSVAIPARYVEEILKLRKFAEERGAGYFIGEVGFRNGDVEGYLYPPLVEYRRFDPAAGYQATIKYYKDVVGQLAGLGISLVGIWNYDGWWGDPFGLWHNPHLSQLLTAATQPPAPPVDNSTRADDSTRAGGPIAAWAAKTGPEVYLLGAAVADAAAVPTPLEAAVLTAPVLYIAAKLAAKRRRARLTSFPP
ncbi:MAG: hypothetical protein OWQ51_13140 [Pyrobaculum arsenaticum]|nr:hypothetical protein [Pyrobaculum arsenaticum]MCY0891886.1 hypothetical protein [Pyrobaculum arsenaticum]NYR15267.1 hypothetical protein [Pyrobaculum arsenaticum]